MYRSDLGATLDLSGLAGTVLSRTRVVLGGERVGVWYPESDTGEAVKTCTVYTTCSGFSKGFNAASGVAGPSVYPPERDHVAMSVPTSNRRFEHDSAPMGRSSGDSVLRRRSAG